MRRMIILLPLLFAFLIFYSCSEEPEVTTENPWNFYNGWTMFFIVEIINNNTNTPISIDIYYALIDKDKKEMYILFTNEFEPFLAALFYPSLGYDSEGIGLTRIFEDEKHPKHLTMIEEILRQNNMTNTIFTFWIEIKKDTNTTVLSGFDESITNIGSGIYGLGTYEGIFDGNSKVTNIHKIIPIGNYTNILSSAGDFEKCKITVNDTNIDIYLEGGERFYGTLRTNFSTNITIPF